MSAGRSCLLLCLVLGSLSAPSRALSTVSSSPAFRLDGTSRSYLQYPAWRDFFSPAKTPGSDAEISSIEQSITDVSLGLEFLADPPLGARPAGGLLLYTDDETGLGGVFIELKLIGGTDLRLRIDDHSGLRTKNIVELRQDINFTDGQWHRLELIKHYRPEKNDDDDDNSEAGGGEVTTETRFEAITLKVDSETIHKRIELSPGQQQPENGAEYLHHGRSVFIGGLPETYRRDGHHQAQLAIPTIGYELHFRGSIRSVHYSAYVEEKQVILQMQSPVVQEGILSLDNVTSTYPNMNIMEHTECSDNVCQHGGYCYATNNGTICDCSVTDYEGPYCQKVRLLPEATFHGTLGEYLGFNSIDRLPIGWAVVSTSEVFEINFRTKVANGLLLFTSDENEDYLAIIMRDAALSLTVKLGTNQQEKLIQPSKVRFDDNQWHTVVVSRKIREISPLTYFCQFSITVDGIYSQVGSTAGNVPYFVFKSIYLGGLAASKDQTMITADNNSSQGVTSAAQLMTGSNFVGCLKKIIYKADNILLDLLDIIERQQHHKSHSSISLFRFHGHSSHHKHSHHHHHQHQQHPMVCEITDATDPITFVTEDSYLKLGGWNAPRNGSISLKLRTNEPNGVLLYTMGEQKESSSNGTRDYFALELLHGQLFMLQNLGSSPVKVKASARRLDDSQWHTITVTRSERSGQIVVDETASDFIAIGAAAQLDLSDVLYLGGVPKFIGHRRTFTPPELWSASLGHHGYIGCLREFTLNGKTIDIAAAAKRQDSGGVKPSCHASASQCSTAPCQNGGTCHEGWNRYTCDCSHTAFTGAVCAKNAATLGFNGEQYLTIVEPEDVRSQAESMSLRFRTTRPTGLLMATSHQHQHGHYLVVALDAGVLKVDVNFGEGHQERVVAIGVGLNDDHWHTIQVERKGPTLKIALDANKRQIIELVGQTHLLNIGHIHIGAWFNPPKGSHARHYKGFVGYMQSFIFNRQSYFEMVRDGQLNSGAIRMTAKFGKKERILHNVVTFKSKHTFVGLPQLKAYTRLDVYFQFKTREADGLIFFNGGGPKHDFVAVELVNGQLHYVFDQGDGTRRLQSKARNALNDNRWHTVTLGRPSLHQHTMLIDDTLITASTTSGNERNLHLDLEGLLYFGGVRDNMWTALPPTIRSRNGFEGCVASLDLNGETFNLAGTEVLIPSTLVETGCSAPITRCSSTACANRGVCVQLWNSYTCDCDLTTFSGPTCAEGNESTAYQFGPKPGLMTFAFDENNRPDTRNDLLALGFLTSQPNGALVRVDSGTSADYMQVEMLDGNILIIYNLGTEDIDIGELNLKLNDGKYHIVRFTRSGQNSTLQIDNHNVITKSPGGKQLNIFNSHAKVQIGGHRNVLKGVIEKPFNGIIAGLVFNGHRLFDMAAEDDPRIAIEGDVELMISIGNQPSGQTTSVPVGSDKGSNQMLSEEKKSNGGNNNNNNANDDLIYSGAGSGCYDVADDEECTHAANEGSGGDELITPVYKVVSRLRPTTAPPSRPNNNNNVYRKNCDNEDDDDCVEGSGGGANDRRPSSRNRGNYTQNQYSFYSTTHRPWTTWLPPTVVPMSRPPHGISRFPPPTYHGGHYPGGYPPGEVYQRPKTTAPAWTKPVYSVSGPSRPINTPPVIIPQGPPEIYEVPLNIPTVANDSAADLAPPPPPDHTLTRLSTNDRTVMIIGIIAIILIVVVIIAPIVLFYKVRFQATNAAFGKMEGFPKMSTMPMLPPGGGGPAGPYGGFAPVVRATSISGIPGYPGMMAHHPGNGMGLTRSVSRPGTRPGTPTDGMGMGGKKKQPHEWYV